MEVRLDRWRPHVDETIETVLPRQIDAGTVEDWFGPAAYAYDPESLQRGFVDPVWELLDRGGTRVRAGLFLALVEGFGLDPTDYLEYACVPVLVHKGALIVDDIEDDADMRQHGPPIHEQFGVDVAVNAGNFLYVLPQHVLLSDPGGLGSTVSHALVADVAQELNRLHLGQTVDIQWQDRTGDDVSLDAYRQMCAAKTGCLFRLAARMATTIADEPAASTRTILRATDELAIAYQITDDRLDAYHSIHRSPEFGKNWGNDVREGKVTPLVIHALDVAEPSARRTLRRILTTADPSEADVETALQILADTGALEHAADLAAEHADRAKTAFRDVEGLDCETVSQLEAFVDDAVTGGS